MSEISRTVADSMGSFIELDNKGCEMKTVITIIIVFLAIAIIFSGIYAVDDKLDPEEAWKKTVGWSSIGAGAFIAVLIIAMFFAKK